MKRLLRIVGFIALLWLAVVLFMPSKALWYQSEVWLSQKKVIMHDEKLEDTLLGLNLHQGELFLGSIQAARMDTVKIVALGFYNSMVIKNLFVGTQLATLKGLHLQEATLRYLPFGDISVSAEGNFGTLQGTIDLGAKQVTLDVIAQPWLLKQPMLMRSLKKVEGGYRFVWHY